MKLKDLIESNNTGLDAIKRAPIVEYDTGIRCLRIGDISNNRPFNDWGYTEVEDNNYKKFQLKKDDIIVARTGATIGVNKYIDKDYKSVYNNGLIRIRVKEENNPKYVYYLLQSNNYRNFIKTISMGTSTQPNMQMNDLLNLEVPEFDRDKQDKIVQLLGNIDKKIELNNEINNNLHELINQNYSNYLQELSDYTELDIKDIFDFKTGVEPGSKNYLEKQEKNTIKFYRVGDMNSECNTFIQQELTNGKLINKDDVVVSFDATIGRIGYGLKGSYSTGMKKITINNKYKDIIDNSMVYAYFNNKDIQNIMMENARGTTILHASSSIDFMKFKYNEVLLKKYNKMISILFDKMKNTKEENEQLFQLRDTLLPKLINGEIDLDNIEI